MKKQIPSVFIADDHQIVIDAIQSELEDFGSSIHFLGSANTGEEVIDAINKQTIDLLILDISMPEPNGMEILKYIKVHQPRTKVLILTMFDDLAHISAMIRNGAHGYILKNEGARYVVDAVSYILAGNKYFPEEITKKMIDGFQSDYFSVNESMEQRLKKSITESESEFLGWLTTDLTAKEIADKMCLSKKAIDAKKLKLQEKIGVNGKGLVRFAFENGFAKK